MYEAIIIINQSDFFFPLFLATGTTAEAAIKKARQAIKPEFWPAITIRTAR